MTTLTIDLEGAARMGIAEAKAHLSNLVERAEKNGEAAILERYGLPAALGLYGGSSFDFVDCVLAAERQELGRDVVTFDKRLVALLGKVGD